MECWASVLTLTFCTTRTLDLSTLRASRTLPPKEIPWHSFLLETCCNPLGYRMRTEVLGHLRIPKDPIGNLNQDLTFCNVRASTTYATAHPNIQHVKLQPVTSTMGKDERWERPTPTEIPSDIRSFGSSSGRSKGSTANQNGAKGDASHSDFLLR